MGRVGALLAGGLVTEAMGLSRKFDSKELGDWWEAIQFCENVEISVKDRKRFAEERMRLMVIVKQQEDEMIQYFEETDKNDTSLIVKIFSIWTKYEFIKCNEVFGR